MSRSARKLGAFLFLSAFAVQFLLSAPSDGANGPTPATRLRFGQRSILSDFDDDGMLDHASIRGTGGHKAIDVYLSRTGRMSQLYFDVSPFEFGSLFAEDIDEDGDTDLIWTDLLHPENVIVWLGDGSGKFDRVLVGELRQQFVIGGSGIFAQQGLNHEKGLAASGNRELLGSVGGRPERQACVAPALQRLTPWPKSAEAEDQADSRAPPIAFRQV